MKFLGPEKSTWPDTKSFVLWGLNTHLFTNTLFSLQSTRQIILGKHRRCLDADIPNKKVVVNPCIDGELSQQWEWGFVNKTAMANWEEFGAKLMD